MGRLLLLLLTLSPPAFSQDAASLAAFSEGRYGEAAARATSAASADDYAFAARALLAEAMCGEGQPAPELLDAAEASARAALKLDAEHIEGRLQLAIVLSLKARPLTVSQARKAGYVSQARELAEEIVKAEPGNAYAHGLLAVWNIEVVRRGGAIGSTVMGASVREARHHYETAIGPGPGYVALHWQYARALTALNARKYRDEAIGVLDLAVAGTSRNALEEVMAGRAALLRAAYETHSRRDLQALAASLL